MNRRLELLFAAVLACSAEGRASACAYSMMLPSPASQAQTHLEDQRERDRAPKERMIYIRRMAALGQVVGPSNPDGRMVLERSRWMRMSAAERQSFMFDPEWEKDAFFKRHFPTARAGTKAYGRASQAWVRQGHPSRSLIGFGHLVVPGEGGCEHYVYWERRSFDTNVLDRAHNPLGGSVVAELYGYTIPADIYPSMRDPQFVVLSYRICRRIEPDGSCV
jgi:hypothetical protein